MSCSLIQSFANLSTCALTFAAANTTRFLYNQTANATSLLSNTTSAFYNATIANSTQPFNATGANSTVSSFSSMAHSVTQASPETLLTGMCLITSIGYTALHILRAIALR